ncbi:MAG: leucine-rich repeat domain-containing protein [Pseudomonadota bacterium]
MTPKEMKPEQREAYELAQERIADAKARGAKLLVLDRLIRDNVYNGETQKGDSRFNHLTALPPEIAELGVLERLDLHGTQITDLSSLAGLSALQTIFLSSTEVTDLSPLARLSALQYLDLDNSQISDLSPLAGLSALQSLFLSDTQFSDLSPLAGLSALQTLLLDHTQVSDLSPLAGLSALQTLHLDNARVSDLSPLAGLSALEAIYFQGIPACEAEPDLKEISEIEDMPERTERLTAWLRERYPLEPPASETPQIEVPRQIDGLQVDAEDGELEVEDLALTAEEIADPLRRKMHERLQKASTALEQKAGNQFYALAQKARVLSKALDCPFEELDPVDVYLELEALRIDLGRDNATREDAYDAELLNALETVVSLGAGLVLGTQDVEVLEGRRDRYFDKPPGPGWEDSLQDLADRILNAPGQFGTRLRHYLATSIQGLNGEARSSGGCPVQEHGHCAQRRCAPRDGWKCELGPDQVACYERRCRRGLWSVMVWLG